MGAPERLPWTREEFESLIEAGAGLDQQTQVAREESHILRPRFAEQRK